MGTSGRGMNRILEHFSSRGGSAWTRLHRPTGKVLKKYKCPPQYANGLEAKVTSQYMVDKGLNNVRGAMFSHPRSFNHKDVDTLTAVIGHHLDLDYEDLRISIREALPPAPSRKRRRASKNEARRDDRCYRCGELGHWAVDCPEIARSE